MQYMLFICGSEAEEANYDEAFWAELMVGYEAFGKEMAERGVLRHGERLRATSDATTVRVRDGEVLTSDGPFAETKEQVGGYYLVECDDLDTAIEIASKIPSAKHGSIEVRPIWEM
jgi:hypothetical protein